jgi:serine/threonine protein kinase
MLAQTGYKAPPLSVGRFQIQGRGGVGVADVFRARDDEDDLAAVFLYTDDAPEKSGLAARMSAAYEAAAAIDHPNVIRVLDAGREGKFGYLVTEWVEGTTLARMIGTHSRLPETNVIRILAQVGQALDHVRKDDQVPCRVSPGNVLVRLDGLAKLIPFPLPDESGAPPTGSTSVPQKPAPAAKVEAGRGPQPVPFAEAIFSLGTTLHEALTGSEWVPPEPPRSSRRRSQQPPRPAGLTDRTERAIRRATDADPARRPASCAELLKLLRPRSVSTGTKKTDARTSTTAEGDRRACVRFAMSVGSNCTINASVFDAPGGSPDAAELWPLVVQDVSATGIGLLLARRCEPGTELSVEVVTGAGRPPRPLPVRVVRVRKDHYGHWLHGCAFLSPLPEPELSALLTQLGRSDTA